MLREMNEEEEDKKKEKKRNLKFPLNVKMRKEKKGGNDDTRSLIDSFWNLSVNQCDS
jgi:hypothetical protein